MISQYSMKLHNYCILLNKHLLILYIIHWLKHNFKTASLILLEVILYTQFNRNVTILLFHCSIKLFKFTKVIYPVICPVKSFAFFLFYE